MRVHELSTKRPSWPAISRCRMFELMAIKHECFGSRCKTYEATTSCRGRLGFGSFGKVKVDKMARRWTISTKLLTKAQPWQNRPRFRFADKSPIGQIALRGSIDKENSVQDTPSESHVVSSFNQMTIFLVPVRLVTDGPGRSGSTVPSARSDQDPNDPCCISESCMTQFGRRKENMESRTR